MEKNALNTAQYVRGEIIEISPVPGSISDQNTCCMQGLVFNWHKGGRQIFTGMSSHEKKRQSDS